MGSKNVSLWDETSRTTAKTSGGRNIVNLCLQINNPEYQV